jgi:hypothetical protein
VKTVCAEGLKALRFSSTTVVGAFELKAVPSTQKFSSRSVQITELLCHYTSLSYKLVPLTITDRLVLDMRPPPSFSAITTTTTHTFRFSFTDLCYNRLQKPDSLLRNLLELPKLRHHLKMHSTRTWGGQIRFRTIKLASGSHAVFVVIPRCS